MTLAVSSYMNVQGLADRPGLLNLAWTLDERGLLSVDIDSLIAEELEREAREGLSFINRYMVTDPYGADALAPAIDTFFGWNGGPGTVTCAAGVVSALHALARLPDTRPVCILRDSYLDLPCWAERAGRRCIALDPAVSPDGYAQSISESGASLLALERPRLLDDRLSTLSEVAALCDMAAHYGTLVLIDESHANYRPPAYSAVTLVEDAANLIVTRGLSKSYGLGSLRLSYCVASNATTEIIRTLIPPLQPSSLSFRIGTRILQLGDIAARQRERIREMKQEMQSLFRQAELPGVLPSSEGLPYVFFDHDVDRIHTDLAARGVLGKVHQVWPDTEAGRGRYYRLSVPLSDVRFTDLRRILLESKGHTHHSEKPQ